MLLVICVVTESNMMMMIMTTTARAAQTGGQSSFNFTDSCSSQFVHESVTNRSTFTCLASRKETLKVFITAITAGCSFHYVLLIHCLSVMS
jgi:hypothetical protein